MSAEALIAETTAGQRIAADPSLSAFVSANAGSGKTRVLTNRVARLLLREVDPSTILCITFTKAAAAEMSGRLFKLLGEWALADDAKLQRELADLDGDARVRSADELARARRLFARALETPGGLKIQTIHSFCESVLKRFPLEAGVPPGFGVIEDVESAKIKQDAVSRVASGADGETAAAFDRLLSRMNGADLRDLLADATGKKRLFARAFDGGWAALGDEVAAAMGIECGETSETLSEKLFGSLSREQLEVAHAALDASGGNPQKLCAAPIRNYLLAASTRDRLAALSKLFLDSKGDPRAKFGTKATQEIDPAIEPFLKTAQQQYLSGVDRIHAADAVEDTRAFLTLMERCFLEYDALKAARAALDFDDLISMTRALLFSNGGAQWVLYKLDMGLAHILLDEAQDTGRDAWSVIEAPLDEFYSGDGARAGARTFFAVGDQKQSIYSFQGADAALFAEKEIELGKKIQAAQAYENVELKASFRTTAPVLRFVDALFKRDDVIEGVSVRKPLTHFCTRTGEAGFVELWPLVKRSKSETPKPWDAPLNAVSAESPARKLATEISGLIAGWLENGETLESQARKVEPGDIMILVQSRGGRSKNALFSEIIRELGKAGVPVAGADKIKLMEDQGVLDLVSYARAVLFSGDDLSLAETLRSPFFDVDEDSLYELAANRAHPCLWRALEERREERENWGRAYDEIVRARTIALNEGAVAFFTFILENGAQSGWRRLAERLGSPSREPIEELIRQAHEFEARHPRSLRLFLDAVVKSGVEVSRESSEAGKMVRVMTAHKAKGLEANIVFLIDAHRLPLLSSSRPLLAIPGAHGGDLPVVALGEARGNSVLSAAADFTEKLTYDEYRRLLYVAATRARDRLYICGCERGNSDPHNQPPARKSWHALSEDAFDELDGVIDAGARFEGRARRFAIAQSVAIKTENAGAVRQMVVAPDECLFQAAPAETRRRRLSPSQLLSDDAADPAYSPMRGSGPFLRGRILHRLLELLPDVAPHERRAAADRLLAHHSDAVGARDLAALREEAICVLEHPQFSELFAPGSLCEVAIGGRPRGGRADLSLSGQIDRLAFCGDRILVVDYKTNRPPPNTVDDVPPSYIAQMAAYRALLQEIYPDRKIETALLWTFEARLMPIPDDVLDRAHALTLA